MDTEGISHQDRIELNNVSAIVRLTKRRIRKETWKEYVSTINSNTTMEKNSQNSRKTQCRRGLRKIY